MASEMQVLGVIEFKVLSQIKSHARLAMGLVTDVDVARQLIRQGLVKADVEIRGSAAEREAVTFFSLTEKGEAALAGADLGVKLESAAVDLGALSESIRQHAEKRGKLQALEQQKKDLLQAVEQANPDLFKAIKDLKPLVEAEEAVLEGEVKKAYGAGVAFSYGLNGIQVEQGTESQIGDPVKLIRWMLDTGKHQLPDVDRRTGQPKLDDQGQPQMIEIVRLVNLHRFVSRYRDQITMGDVPEMTIVESVKVSWSMDLPALWEQGITLGPPAPPDEPDEDEAL